MKRCAQCHERLGLGEQMSEFETYLNERQRMTTASLSAIEKAGPGQRDGAHKRQQTLTELTPSCGVA
jgi:hypothetical protein